MATGMDEFELIHRYFAQQTITRADVRVPIGDDGAITSVPAGMQLVVTTDVLTADVHFFADADPRGIGHKSLAVNLSDLAAMGAEPAWFLLSLTLPTMDAGWLGGFAEGLHTLAQRYGMQLIGGDTTRGSLSITVTAMGLVPEGKGMLRSGAKVGDQIIVTGELGDAALALAVRRGRHALTSSQHTALMPRLERPSPRVAEGLALRDIASSAIDISDGLLADLGHISKASGVGARLMLDKLPLSSVYRDCLKDVGWDYALAGGDDYELCLTVPARNMEALQRLARERGFRFTSIGEVTTDTAIDIMDPAGKPYRPVLTGYNHFTNT